MNQFYLYDNKTPIDHERLVSGNDYFYVGDKVGSLMGNIKYMDNKENYPYTPYVARGITKVNVSPNDKFYTIIDPEPSTQDMMPSTTAGGGRKSKRRRIRKRTIKCKSRKNSRRRHRHRRH